jgi:UDP-N-acetylglucosamine 3-dehydrogenase
MILKTAVIGVGNMGQHHARIYSGLPECRLAAVADIDEKKGKEIADRFRCSYYRDYREMLAKEQLDAVSIVVPTAKHREVALACIERGLHVLVEKPIAGNIDDAMEMIKKAREKGVKLAVGHIERFNPAVQKLKEIVSKGELGEITTIIARRVGVFPPQIKDANVIVDIGVHDIDIFNYLLEKKPVKITAAAGKALIDNREDYADILLKYDGTNAFVQVNWITPVKIRNLAVTGTKGYAELNYITQELRLYKSKYKLPEKTFQDVVEFAKPEEIEVKIEKQEPLKLELKSFLDCIIKNKEPLVTGEDGLAALEIALKAVQQAGD